MTTKTRHEWRNVLPEPLRAWWRDRGTSERRALRLGAWILGPLLAVFGLLLPVLDQVERLERAHRDQEVKLSAMRAMAAALPTGAGAPEARISTLDPAALPAMAIRIDAELKAAGSGFRGSATPADGGVEIVLERAGFDALLMWLERVQQRDRLFAAEVRLRAAPGEAGQVGGRVRLKWLGA